MENYRHKDVQRTDDRWFQLRINDDNAKLNHMPRFVDGLVRLDEDRVALFRVIQLCRVDKTQSTRSASCQVVFTRPQFTNLNIIKIPAD